MAEVPAYAGFEVVRLSLHEWRSRWLPGLQRDGIRVGQNWSGEGATGYDLLPAEVEAGEPPRVVGFSEEFRQRVTVQGIGASLVSRGSGGRGSDREQEMTMRYSHHGLTGLRVTYAFVGTVLATEDIDLRE